MDTIRILNKKVYLGQVRKEEKEGVGAIGSNLRAKRKRGVTEGQEVRNWRRCRAGWGCEGEKVTWGDQGGWCGGAGNRIACIKKAPVVLLSMGCVVEDGS